MRVFFVLFSGLLLAFIAGSCSTATAPITAPPPQIEGQVTLEDSSGVPIPFPYSGITVSIPNAQLSTTTDSLGNFAFQSVPDGRYGEVVSKQGFDDNITQISCSSNSSLLQRLMLTNAPDSIVRLDLATEFWGDTNLIYIFATSKASNVFFTIDRSPNVPTDSLHFITPIQCQRNNTVQWYGDCDMFRDLGMKYGDTAYVSAFPVNGRPIYGGDGAGGRYTITNAGPRSNVIPVVIY